MTQAFEPKNPARIIERYLQGESAREIALDFGYTQQNAIRKFLVNAGVKMRSREEAQEIARQRRMK